MRSRLDVRRRAEEVCPMRERLGACALALIAASCTSVSNGSGASSSSVDGTWDFVASTPLVKYHQGTAIVNGGSATLDFDYTIDDPGYCTYHRVLAVAVKKLGPSSANATSSIADDDTGPYCNPFNGPRAGFTATRTSTADGFGDWGGTWQISSPEFKNGAICIVQLSGQHATGTCPVGTGIWEGSFDVTLGNGALSGTTTGIYNVVTQIAASRR